MEGDNHDPVWSPDSRYIIFHRAEYGITSIFRQKADGSQSAELLAQSNGFNPRLSSLSSGKPKLLFSEENPTTRQRQASDVCERGAQYAKYA